MWLINACDFCRVVNYSISLGLGLAGTIESQVRYTSGLNEYRGALYLGIGLAGLGDFLSLAFLGFRVYLPLIRTMQDN